MGTFFIVDFVAPLQCFFLRPSFEPLKLSNLMLLSQTILGFQVLSFMTHQNYCVNDFLLG